ncbi:myoneurin [Lingula anatina]|uniref:Myoneurin n=1 Tax=Lingula anatina TaxID=7574 RepID=A0A1S3HRX6_LINAN|nr:myoneurin [Lingula anatina]|eukprot:XP_013388785.1 myoneurin [Lingula anatina]
MQTANPWKKPYVCGLCGHQFVHLLNLGLHVRTLHLNKESTFKPRQSKRYPKDIKKSVTSGACKTSKDKQNYRETESVRMDREKEIHLEQSRVLDTKTDELISPQTRRKSKRIASRKMTQKDKHYTSRNMTQRDGLGHHLTRDVKKKTAHQNKNDNQDVSDFESSTTPDRFEEEYSGISVLLYPGKETATPPSHPEDPSVQTQGLSVLHPGDGGEHHTESSSDSGGTDQFFLRLPNGKRFLIQKEMESTVFKEVDSSAEEGEKENVLTSSMVTCNICQKTYTARSIKSHKCREICERCGRVFPHMKALRNHQAYGNNCADRVLPLVCDLCGYVASNRHRWKEHVQQLHSDVRPFQCSVPDCNKSFKVKAALQHHIKYRHGTTERKVKCEICSKTWHHPAQLRTHMKTHSGTRNYECELCLKTFTTKSNLDQHSKTAHGNTVYSCALCHFTTIHRNSMKRHMKLVHKILEATFIGEQPPGGVAVTTLDVATEAYTDDDNTIGGSTEVYTVADSAGCGDATVDGSTEVVYTVESTPAEGDTVAVESATEGAPSFVILEETAAVEPGHIVVQTDLAPHLTQ